jgi:diguanylate cyclase (GGDEF)-like protein
MSNWRHVAGPVTLFFVGAVPAGLALARGAGAWTIAAAVGALAMGAGFLVLHLLALREVSVRERGGQKLAEQVARLEGQVRERERQLEEVRSHDETTGALNRRAFLRRFDETAQRDGRLAKPMAFLLLDVQGFRAINDRLGRLAGDQVLRLTARAVQGCTRGTDAVGRLGGDEFGVVLGECEDPRPAVDRIQVALSALNVPGTDEPVRVSIGSVWIESAEDGVDAAEVFRAAESALTSVRGQGVCGSRTIPKRSGGRSVFA